MWSLRCGGHSAVAVTPSWPHLQIASPGWFTGAGVLVLLAVFSRAHGIHICGRRCRSFSPRSFVITSGISQKKPTPKMPSNPGSPPTPFPSTTQSPGSQQSLPQSLHPWALRVWLPKFLLSPLTSKPTDPSAGTHQCRGLLIGMGHAVLNRPQGLASPQSQDIFARCAEYVIPSQTIRGSSLFCR